MDIGTIENMIGEHPFGISDAAIDEIVEAVKQLALEQRAAGMLDGINLYHRLLTA